MPDEGRDVKLNGAGWNEVVGVSEKLAGQGRRKKKRKLAKKQAKNEAVGSVKTSDNNENGDTLEDGVCSVGSFYSQDSDTWTAAQSTSRMVGNPDWKSEHEGQEAMTLTSDEQTKAERWKLPTATMVIRFSKDKRGKRGEKQL